MSRPVYLNYPTKEWNLLGFVTYMYSISYYCCSHIGLIDTIDTIISLQYAYFVQIKCVFFSCTRGFSPVHSFLLKKILTQTNNLFWMTLPKNSTLLMLPSYYNFCKRKKKRKGKGRKKCNLTLTWAHLLFLKQHGGLYSLLWTGLAQTFGLKNTGITGDLLQKYRREGQKYRIY